MKARFARRTLHVTGRWALGAALTFSACAVVSASPASARPAATWHLDAGFGTGGVVRTPFGGDGIRFAWGYQTMVQSDGRILEVGVASTGLRDWLALARYHRDGTLDTSFGTGGRVLIGPHARYVPEAVATQDVHGVTKTVVAVATTFTKPYRYRCSLLRLNPDGSLDTDHDADPSVVFGNEGIKVLTVGPNDGFCGGMAVLPGGDIVGSADSGANGGDVVVYRLHGTNGSLVRSFGDGGRFEIDEPGFQASAAVAVERLPRGAHRIIVGGLAEDPHGYSWGMWGVTLGGALDQAFGDGGAVVTSMRDSKVQQSFDSITTLATTHDGTIVAGGDYRSWPSGENAPQDTAAVDRYLPDGSLDTSFGAGGITHVPYDGRGDTDTEALLLGNDGSVRFSGALSMPTSGAMLVAGVDQTGAPDPAFGADGVLELPLDGGPYTSANGLALDARGRLVAGGIDGQPDGGAGDAFGVIRLTR